MSLATGNLPVLQSSLLSALTRSWAIQAEPDSLNLGVQLSHDPKAPCSEYSNMFPRPQYQPAFRVPNAIRMGKVTPMFPDFLHHSNFIPLSLMVEPDLISHIEGCGISTKVLVMLCSISFTHLLANLGQFFLAYFFPS